ncbi:MAG: hypothetical protein ACFNKL_00025 [Treponema sp.]
MSFADSIFPPSTITITIGFTGSDCTESMILFFMEDFESALDVMTYMK